MNGQFRRVAASAAVLALLILPACSPSESADGGGSTIDVTLQEWAVVVDEASAPAGEVTFSVTNDGPADIHEFVIMRTDLDPADLPTDEHGAVDEGGDGMEVIDEIEDLEVGDTQDVTVDLETGSYVLLCNIYSEDEDEAHYAEGMRVAFDVE
jgi:uncharacterized cupredoxin-like copper-binding protein